MQERGPPDMIQQYDTTTTTKLENCGGGGGGDFTYANYNHKCSYSKSLFSTPINNLLYILSTNPQSRRIPTYPCNHPLPLNPPPIAALFICSESHLPCVSLFLNPPFLLPSNISQIRLHTVEHHNIKIIKFVPAVSQMPLYLKDNRPIREYFNYIFQHLWRSRLGIYMYL